MRVEVEVTEEDLATGVPQKIWDCPLAIALNRATQGVGLRKQYAVTCNSVVTTDNGLSGSYSTPLCELPREAKQAVARIDIGKSVAPFFFEIDLPEEI